MTVVDDTWAATVDSVGVVQSVETRLARAGAIVELRQLQGLSTFELERLVHRETHWPVS